jgi:transcriptional regulator with XRE-family HTH domain
MNDTDIKKSILRILEARKISLTRFAAECGVKQTSLWRYMNGKTGLSGENLLRLLARLEEDEVPQQ